MFQYKKPNFQSEIIKTRHKDNVIVHRQYHRSD